MSYDPLQQAIENLKALEAEMRAAIGCADVPSHPVIAVSLQQVQCWRNTLDSVIADLGNVPTVQAELGRILAALKQAEDDPGYCADPDYYAAIGVAEAIVAGEGDERHD